MEQFFLDAETGRSPSMRREWIEIKILADYETQLDVSLHAEGVD